MVQCMGTRRCLVPDCESEASRPAMRPPWLSASATAAALAETCRPYALEVECGGRGRRNVSVPCDRWVYPDKDLSIMTEVSAAGVPGHTKKAPSD